MLVRCPECQKEISDKAASCIHCGSPLAKGTKPEVTRPGESQQRHAESSEQKMKVWATPNTPKRIHWLYVTAISAAAFIALVFLVGVVFKPRWQPAEAKPTVSQAVTAEEPSIPAISEKDPVAARRVKQEEQKTVLTEAAQQEAKEEAARPPRPPEEQPANKEAGEVKQEEQKIVPKKTEPQADLNDTLSVSRKELLAIAREPKGQTNSHGAYDPSRTSPDGFPLFYYALWSKGIGAAGALGKVKVWQVVDENNFIAEFRALRPDLQESRFCWIEGLSTLGMVDGEWSPQYVVGGSGFKEVIKVVGTKQYKTAIGGAKTIYYAKKVNIVK